MSDSLTVRMVAGEASGDLLAHLLIRGLREQWPLLDCAGIAGPQMAAAGCAVWAPSERLSVFGYADAVRRLPELLWLRAQTRRRIVRERPDVFVGIDAPDFNFGLERRVRQAGIPAVHFVCPSVWAWRPHRLTRLREAADHVLCLFPFEPALLQAAGIAASYVGHPLADVIPQHSQRNTARALLGYAPDQTLVALLPGSRRSEMERIGPVLQATVLDHLMARPGVQFILPLAPGLRSLASTVLAGLNGHPRVRWLEGQSHTALAAADAAVVASGTATLEAALLQCPMVIVYRLAPSDWKRMARQRLQPWVGLPNILTERFLVPERLQDDAEPGLIARDVERWLDEPEAVAAFRASCAQLHETLRQDTGRKAAAAIAQCVEQRI